MEIVVKKTSLKKMFHEKGVNVSTEALDMLANIVSDFTEKIVDKAVMAAKHAGRKTVKVDDIKLINELSTSE